MDMDDRYQYTKLAEPDSIRLILLQPSTDLEAQVQCDLLTTSLTECDEDVIDGYTAISYVWGVATDTRTISVAGKAMKITASLDSALRHIRSHDGICRLWADALCINQADILERNQQVRQMASIYSCAFRTIIYLGSSIPEVESLLNRLRIAASRFKQSDLDNPSLVTYKSEVPGKAETHLLHSSWLKRIWVLQELVFSPDPWVQCGTARLRWDDFCKHFKLFNSDEAGEQAIGGPLSGREILLGMAEFRSSYRDNTDVVERDTSLMGLLKSRRALGVSDPRDMLFAHLGIVRLANNKQTQGGMIDVDYSKNCSEVYEEIARYFIQTHKKLKVLSLVGDVELETRRPGMASWAPDWTVARGQTRTSIQEAVERLRSASARAGPPSPENQMSRLSSRNFSFVSGGSVMVCAGGIIDVVNDLSLELSESFPLFDMDRITNLFNAGNYATLKEDIGEVFHDACQSFGAELGPEFLSVLMSNQHMKSHTGYARRWRGFPGSSTKEQSSLATLIGWPIEKSDGYTEQYLMRRLSNVRTWRELGFLLFFSGRRLAALPNGMLALVPVSARKGDVACLLAGSEIPFLLRPLNSSTIQDNTIYDLFPVEDQDPQKRPPDPCCDCGACYLSSGDCNRNVPCSNCHYNRFDCNYDNPLDVRKLDIGHYQFVGECFVEKETNGWGSVLDERKKKMLFAVY